MFNLFHQRNNWRVVILIFIQAVVAQNVFSQVTWAEGVIITIDADSLHGKIKNKILPNTWEVVFINTEDNVLVVYEASEIAGYINGERVYESNYVFPNYLFLEKIETGKICLYKAKNQYYLKKENNDIKKINKLIKWSIIKHNIADNSALLRAVEGGSAEFTTVESVIKEYNRNALIATTHEEPQEVTVDAQEQEEKNEKQKVPLPKQKAINAKIDILGIGAAVEARITNNISLVAQPGYGMDLLFSSGNATFYPYLKIQTRFYTNLRKRAAQGKVTDKFSGSYISPQYRYSLEGMSFEESDKTYLYGLSYGIQRKKSNHIYWGMEFGVGAKETVGVRKFEPVLLADLSLGFVF